MAQKVRSRALIIAFAQSEKVKTGLLWVGQLIDAAAGAQQAEHQKLAATLVGLIHREMIVAMRLAAHAAWERAEQHLQLAQVMIRSGVPHEAGFHLTRALSEVTQIGQQAMTGLQQANLI